MLAFLLEQAMSLRRKIALWLCPELGQPEETQCIGSAQAWAGNVSAMSTLCRENAIHAQREADKAAWKAEVLEQLKTISQAVIGVTKNGNAMSVDAIAAIHTGSGVISGQTSSQASC